MQSKEEALFAAHALGCGKEDDQVNLRISMEVLGKRQGCSSRSRFGGLSLCQL